MKTEIIYEDKDCLVVYKPAGLPCQSAKVTCPDMVSELTKYLKGEKVHLVHRLDQPVEGLLIVAKNRQCASYFSECVASKQGEGEKFSKSYVACVKSKDTLTLNQRHELKDYMKKDAKNNRAEIVNKQDAAAKQAWLIYSAVKIAPVSLLTKEDEILITTLRVELMTGRFHQIRAQLSHAGMPILGDLKYASEETKRISQALHISSVALCADKLSFIHPRTKKEMQFEVKPRNDIFNF